MNLYSGPTLWRWLKNPFFLKSFDIGKKFSTQLDITTIDLHAESDGKIRRKIEAVCLQLGASDSGSSSNNCFVNLYNAPESLYAMQLNIGNRKGLMLPDGHRAHEQGIVACDQNGNISYRCSASGANSLEISIIVVGVAVGIR